VSTVGIPGSGTIRFQSVTTMRANERAFHVWNAVTSI
jgi:hypothetical protein